MTLMLLMLLLGGGYPHAGDRFVRVETLTCLGGFVVSPMNVGGYGHSGGVRGADGFYHGFYPLEIVSAHFTVS